MDKVSTCSASDYMVAWICALQNEFIAAGHVLDEIYDHSHLLLAMEFAMFFSNK
jgi:hypothetical protein